MSGARALIWDNIDREYRAGVAHQFARYALSLRFEDLPEDVVHQAKRSLLDGIGCAIGGYKAPGRAACEDVAIELGGPQEATIIGSGIRTSAINATLVNCFLLRFLEYNDIGGGNHNSDAIPSLLAVAERGHASGRDFLIAMVLSYELGVRVVASVPGGAAGWDDAGWSTDARGGLSMPPAIGRLMGLDEAQIAHAVGICASRGVPLGILDADKEENSMAKNLRFGAITRDAILACMLAKRGLTGPLRIVEGDAGFRDGVLGGAMDLGKLTDFSGWRIRETMHKRLCANGSTQGHIQATIDLVTEHDLKPSDIASVRIRACGRESRHTTALAKKYPRNAETADHSAYYANAFAIKHRQFGPDSADPQHFTDPEILELIDKITVVHDPALPARGREGISEIATVDGRTLSCKRDVFAERMSDGELEAKFSELAAPYYAPPALRDLVERVRQVDRVADIGELMAMLAFARTHARAK